MPSRIAAIIFVMAHPGPTSRNVLAPSSYSLLISLGRLSGVINCCDRCLASEILSRFAASMYVPVIVDIIGMVGGEHGSFSSALRKGSLAGSMYFE